MEDATSETKDTTSSAAAPKLKGRHKMRRIASGIMAMALALTGVGFLVNALTPDAQTATAQQDEAAMIQQGKELYDAARITCHGANPQGVKDRDKSLTGVGEGSVYFQVHSGHMPMLRNEAQAACKIPRCSGEQTLAIVVYVQANGGGADIVRDEDGSTVMESLRGKDAGLNGEIDRADVVCGSELFRLNCASCHNFTNRGGALSSGRYVPVLDPVNEQEVY